MRWGGGLTYFQCLIALGVEHAGVKRLVPVLEADHVEADGLGDGQDEGQHPYAQDLQDGQRGDAHPLDSAPGRHGPVPVVDGALGQRSKVKPFLRPPAMGLGILCKKVCVGFFLYSGKCGTRAAEEMF